MKKFIIQPEFTNHCNFKCIFCPHSVYKGKSEGGNIFNREKGFMSNELFNIFLENAERYAERIIIGFFGEPFLHPKFEEYIKSFPLKRNYKIELYTNWSLVTKKNMKLLKLIDSIFISLDASNSVLWERLCPGGKVLDLKGNPSDDRYQTITKKIDYWLNLPDHPVTEIIYAISSINEKDKNKFIKEWVPKLSRKDHILTKSILSYGGVMKDNHMNSNECNVKFGNRFTIAWNGDCTPCNLDVNIGLNVGNLLKIKDMEKIIKGNKWKKNISNIKQKKGICSNCFDANNWTEHKLYYNRKN